MKYIVVTGGAGFIGSSLIEYLLIKTKKNIISIDNYSTGSKLNHIKNQRVKYLKTHTKNIYKSLKKESKKIDAVFHFAEFSRIAQSFDNLSKCFDSNIEGTCKVINFCLDNKIKIIYSATSASLGNHELDQHLSPYAYTKANNMNLIMNLNEWFGLKYEIIYFYNVYGKRQILSSGMAAVVGIFENCLKKNKPLPVVLPGTQSRRFTHVNDTIDACFIAWKENKCRHYSISNKKSHSIIDVAKMFKSKIKFLPKRAGERYASALTNSNLSNKISKHFGKINLKDYILNFLKNN